MNENLFNVKIILNSTI